MKRLFILLVLIGVGIFLYALYRSHQPPSPAPTSTAPPPRASGQSTQFTSKLNKFKELATEQGVGIIQADEVKPGVVIIEIYGRDHTELNRYLTAVQEEISLQDFEGGYSGMFQDSDGRHKMKARYKFTYRVR